MESLVTGTIVRGTVSSPPRVVGSELFFLDLRDVIIGHDLALPPPDMLPPQPLQVVHFIFSSDHFANKRQLRQLRRDTRRKDVLTI